ncbi:MAG TPA: GspH/FimT family pseudopilin [Burkholderiales bacterium]|nr:GspH/FimT family pseudopilin [Burkholderiales bacterium]
MRCTHQDARGFSLIELMAVIAIAVIALCVAMPGYQNFRAEQHVAARANELIADLNAARMEAMRRGGQASLTSTGPTAPDRATGWQTQVVDASSATPSTIVLTVRQITDPNDYVKATGAAVFNSLGNLSTASSSPAFYLCSVAGATTHARRVNVQPSGRSEISSNVAANCQ